MNLLQFQLLAPLFFILGMYLECSLKFFCIFLLCFVLLLPKLSNILYRFFVFLILGLFRGLFINHDIENYSYKYTSFQAKIHNIQYKDNKVFLILKDFKYIEGYKSKLLLKTDSRALFPKEAKMELDVKNIEDLSKMDEIIAIGRFYLPSPKLHNLKTRPKGIIKEITIKSYKKQTIKDYCRKKLYKTLNKRAAAVCSAIFFGDIFSVDNESKELFSKTGISYLLGPSILNLTLILYILYYFFYKFLGYFFIKLAQYIPLKILARLLSFISIFIYFLILGEDFPLFREFIMYNLFLVVSLYKKKNQLELLIYTALITLGIFPEGIYSISFQLTFGGVLGILAFQYYNKNWLVSSLKMTSSALSFIIPLSIYHFHSIALQPYIATLLIMPILTFFLIPIILLHLLIPEEWSFLTSYMIENLFNLIFLILNMLKNISFFVHFRPISSNFLMIFIVFYIFFAIIKEKIRYLFLCLGYLFFGVGVYKGYYFKPFILVNIYNTVLIMNDKIIVYPKFGFMAKYLGEAYDLPCFDGKNSQYFHEKDGVLYIYCFFYENGGFVLKKVVQVVKNENAMIDYTDQNTYILSFDEMKNGFKIEI